MAFTSQHGASFAMSCIKVEGGEPMWMFPMLVSGGLNEWRFIDKILWRSHQSP
ncbi:MAG: hypothetical protein V7K38_27435 [Nostoc sp.]|uniref:hypothetical protein n=1 Tax=Nostoc sp. TaxID=1180 RepID=UPI002FFB5CD5